MMDVKVLPSLPVSASEFTTRVNPFTRNNQILSLDVLYSFRRRLCLCKNCHYPTVAVFFDKAKSFSVPVMMNSLRFLWIKLSGSDGQYS
jgi:hypothetical protein